MDPVLKLLPYISAYKHGQRTAAAQVFCQPLDAAGKLTVPP
jgi:hypothetical protein